eukprot:1505296-Prymnesium_polylepis.2
MWQWMYDLLRTTAAILLAGIVYIKTNRCIRQYHGRTGMCSKTLPKPVICTNSLDAELKPGQIWVQMMHQSLEINPTSRWADQDEDEVIHPLTQHTLQENSSLYIAYHVLITSQQAQSHPNAHARALSSTKGNSSHP